VSVRLGFFQKGSIGPLFTICGLRGCRREKIHSERLTSNRVRFEVKRPCFSIFVTLLASCLCLSVRPPFQLLSPWGNDLINKLIVPTYRNITWRHSPENLDFKYHHPVKFKSFIRMVGIQLVKTYPAFYGIWRLIIMPTRVHHLTLSIHTLTFSVIHLRLSRASGLFIPSVSTEVSYKLYIFPTRATCSAHLVPLHFVAVIIFGEGYKLRSFSFYKFSASFYFHLGPNIRHHFFLKRPQISHPCETKL